MDLLTAMEKNKLCNPGTLRSNPRSTTLGVSTGFSVAESSSSADPVIPTPLFPTSALVLESVERLVLGSVGRVSETAVVAEPEDLDGWTTVAVAQEGSGGVDGLSSAAEENEEASVKDRDLSATSRKVIVHYSGS